MFRRTRPTIEDSVVPIDLKKIRVCSVSLFVQRSSSAWSHLVVSVAILAACRFTRLINGASSSWVAVCIASSLWACSVLSGQDEGFAVGVGIGLVDNGRGALRADGATDGHEESSQSQQRAHAYVSSKSECVPKSGGRTSHVLTQGSQHSIGTRTESDDVGCAKDETDDETDT
jgi:hypothetical protein